MIDYYQASLRDDIIAWHNTLKKSGSSSDWLIVVVETPDSRQAIIPPHLLTFRLFLNLPVPPDTFHFKVSTLSCSCSVYFFDSKCGSVCHDVVSVQRFCAWSPFTCFEFPSFCATWKKSIQVVIYNGDLDPEIKIIDLDC